VTLTPAQKLDGQKLSNGWTVKTQVNKKPGATGGFFSIGYTVVHENGNEAFLKAIDFSDAFRSADPARELQPLVETFNFERDLLEKCKSKNLDRVVRALESGTTTIDGIPVPYLIFELADGDIRTHMDISANLDLAWTLRMLHHVAVGLKQLHGLGIAHQDIKPSNVLVFAGVTSKLADLGRAAHPDFKPPHHDNFIPGDYSYSPPELRYGYIHPDFNQRRFGADAFLLGNIILFSFTRLTMSAVLLSFLAPEHMPVTWRSTYQEVLPYLLNAFNNALNSVEQNIPEEVRDEVIQILRQLCEPDLLKRGRSINRNKFSLEQYITKLDILAYKAERHLFKNK
jgi:eukaryotic-like serine/threonine-protein kinase